MEVHIQIQRRAESLHQCDGAGRAGGASEAGLADEVARDRSIRLAEHQRQCLRIGRQQEPQRMEVLKSQTKIENQVEQFLDRIVDADTPSVIAAYETRIKRLENQKILLKEKIMSSGRPMKSFDDSLRTALEFLANPWKLWDSGELEHRRMVLKLAFGKPLAYVRNEGFRTANLAWPFKALSQFGQGINNMVGPLGLEPRTKGFTSAPPFPEGVDYLFTPEGCGTL